VRSFVLLVIAACSHGTPAPNNAVPPAPPPQKQPGRIVVTSTTVEQLPPITFIGQTTQIELTSLRTVDAIADTLNGNPSILLVEVRAFGADGLPAFQQQIGEQRAQAVVAELIKRKVDPRRLRPHGMAVPPQGVHGVVFEILARSP
jgi:outer membrane protein OmpA-like peptidoglycan-associated protein